MLVVLSESGIQLMLLADVDQGILGRDWSDNDVGQRDVHFFKL